MKDPDNRVMYMTIRGILSGAKAAVMCFASLSKSAVAFLSAWGILSWSDTISVGFSSHVDPEVTSSQFQVVFALLSKSYCS